MQTFEVWRSANSLVVLMFCLPLPSQIVIKSFLFCSFTFLTAKVFSLSLTCFNRNLSDDSEVEHTRTYTDNTKKEKNDHLAFFQTIISSISYIYLHWVSKELIQVMYMLQFKIIFRLKFFYPGCYSISFAMNNIQENRESLG